MHKEKEANEKRLNMFKGKSPEEIFTLIYNKNHWSSNESKSGTGSTLIKTVNTRKTLLNWFKKYNINGFLDIACGDFNWMKEIVNDLNYYKGIDIVKEEIDINNKKYGSKKVTFEHYDITKGFKYNGNDFDVVFAKDILVHFPDFYIKKFLDEVKSSGIKYMVITNFTKIDKNISLDIFGQWRPINFSIDPFNLPLYTDTSCEKNEPYTWNNKKYNDKNITLWEIDKL